jgi:hypothetical protein
VAQVPLPGWPQAPVQTPALQVGVCPAQLAQLAPAMPQVLLLWSSCRTQKPPSLQQPVGQEAALQTQAPLTHSWPGGQAGLQLPLPPVPLPLFELPQPTAAVASASASASRARTDRACMLVPR